MITLDIGLVFLSFIDNQMIKETNVSRKIATQGTKTTTGGEVLEGIPDITLGGQPATVVGMQATCKSGRKNCKGIGKIAAIGSNPVFFDDGQQAALKDYQVLCGCNDNFICEPSHSITVEGNHGSYHFGNNVHFGANVEFGRIPTDPMKQYVPPEKRSNPVLDQFIKDCQKAEARIQAEEAAQASLNPSKLVGLASGGGAEHVSEELAGSLSLECSLEDALNENHEQVAILDELDAHILLHNIWVDMGRYTLALATFINNAKSWGNHIEPIFNTAGLVKQFKDLNLTVDLVKNKAGKWCYAFASKKNPNLKHVLANGVRINMNRKFPLNSLKMTQLGLSPQVKLANFKGSAALTFILSASIATTNLVFNDDYHLVNWVGNVGSDMFKALVQFGAGEAALGIVILSGGTVLVGAIVATLIYGAIEIAWTEFNISPKVISGLKLAIEGI